METNTNYQPESAIFSALQIKQTVKTDKAWLDIIRTNVANEPLLVAQNAVATYTLYMRGTDLTALAHEIGVDEKTVRRWKILGIALLRTCNAPAESNQIARVVTAVKMNGWMSQSAVDDATKVDAPDEQKIERLETLAAGKYLTSTFVTTNKSGEQVKLTEKQVHEIVATLPEQAKKNNGSQSAPTAQSMTEAVPNIAEKFGISRKETTRTAQTGTDGPMGLEFHFKAALKDMRHIVKETNTAYVPTPQEVKLLLTICSEIGLSLNIDAQTAAAIDALA